MSDTNRPLPLGDLLSLADPGLSPERRAELTGRLAASTDERARLIGLLSLKNGLKKAAPPLPIPFELTDACVPTEEMGDFLGGRMPTAEREVYSRHVADCDPCFERAAFFTASSAAMTGGVMAMEKTPARFRAALVPDYADAPVASPLARRIGPSPVARMGRWLASPLPAYALAATLLIALVAGPKTPGLTEYQGESSFSLYELDPQGGASFGFSDTGRLVGESVADLSARRADNGDVTLGWRPVEGADRYLVTVTRLTPKGPVDLLELPATEPTVTIPAASLAPGELYRYRIAGTAGERLFAATGQFGVPR
ncbi:MAG: hypothetical protein HQK87_05570 [Nitrospinae bacterium]|nr:hypothetical protein [Nitrospinota bacterium]